ncbi:MAG TPA: hypothetical protein VHB53_01715 [Solirubrobacterales bacterium]|nr:hypothetical protein [Solirubrobacterales bacterium]
MRALLPLTAIAALALLLGGCGGSDATLESLAGTPAAIHIVKDVEAMAHACGHPGKKSRQAGVKAYANLAKITSIHPDATFGPEDTEVTMRQLLRRSVEKTGHCIGVSVDADGRYHVD